MFQPWAFCSSSLVSNAPAVPTSWGGRKAGLGRDQSDGERRRRGRCKRRPARPSAHNARIGTNVDTAQAAMSVIRDIDILSRAFDIGTCVRCAAIIVDPKGQRQRAKIAPKGQYRRGDTFPRLSSGRARRFEAQLDIRASSSVTFRQGPCATYRSKCP
jgi:hypothetical protein